MAQKFDNESSRMRAQRKVKELVGKGYRLNPERASSTYHQSVLGSPKATRREKQDSATRLATAVRTARKRKRKA